MPEKEKGKYKILIVDDDPFIINSIYLILNGSYDLSSVSSAEEMFIHLEDHVPDLILLDIMMEDMDGLSALQLLRSNKKYEGITVVLLTGVNNENSEIRGYEVGANDYIYKPFNPVHLKHRIQIQLDLMSINREYGELKDAIATITSVAS